mmetsp:Transcript_118031/g.328975  ORF Transcript_118031/g.328975 Transcript_118031/m.328975 type:complete len:190 (+) Transcript_118031:327-896(+)
MLASRCVPYCLNTQSGSEKHPLRRSCSWLTLRLTLRLHLRLTLGLAKKHRRSCRVPLWHVGRRRILRDVLDSAVIAEVRQAPTQCTSMERFDVHSTAVTVEVCRLPADRLEAHGAAITAEVYRAPAECALAEEELEVHGAAVTMEVCGTPVARSLVERLEVHGAITAEVCQAPVERLEVHGAAVSTEVC